VKIVNLSLSSMVIGILGLMSFVSVTDAQQKSMPKVTEMKARKATKIANGNNLYCAGYVETGKIDTSFEIVGSDEEPERYAHTEGEYLYINAGSNQGVKVGDEFSVIRPKGKVKTKNSKKNNLGVYVEEVGGVEIVKVRSDVSVAFIKSSCDYFLFGDLLQKTVKRTSPLSRKQSLLDRFADANGKAIGNIIFAREGREMLSRDNIVYIDLGAQDSVNVGDYLTIFRPLGKGNPTNPNLVEEANPARSSGYESKEYQGGGFSNQTPRKAGDEAQGGVVQPKDVKKRRPANLRKVVGEMVILGVREKTATAVITRTDTEIHTSDKVEIQ
jgi:hypothetical protein